MLAERPDLLNVMYEPFHVDWRGDHPDGAQPWYDIPMLTARDGRVAAARMPSVGVLGHQGPSQLTETPRKETREHES